MKNIDTLALIPKTYLIYASLALLSTIVFLINLYFSLQQNQHLYDNKLALIKEQAHIDFSKSEKYLNTQFELLISHYKQMPVYIDAIKNNQRQKLYELSLPDYKNLRSIQPHLYVMHYFDTNNKTILRMHKPQSYGDDLSKIRPIVAFVNHNKIQASGFEGGKNGITYRITTPLFDQQNDHIGVLEFGINLDYFIEEFAQRFNVKSEVLVKTDSLDNLTYKTSFKTRGEYTVFYQDPELINRHLQSDEQIWQKDNKTYLVIPNISLNSYDGQAFVKFNFLKDITEFHQYRQQQIQSFILLNLVTLTIFLISLYFILRSYKNRILHATKALKNSENRQQYFKNHSEKDSLTGALNRRSWQKDLRKLIHQAPFNQHGIIFLDIDHFKQINDECGHLIGDKVLQQLTKSIKNQFRVHDQFYRWGGEEFALILKNVSLEQTLLKAEEIRKNIEQNHWPENLKITVSIGVTTIRTDDSIEALQTRMDELMYQAKSKGRNCCVSD